MADREAGGDGREEPDDGEYDEYDDDFEFEGDDEADDDFDEVVDELDEDEDDEDGLFTVTAEARTICHLCGGAGYLANPVAAVIGGVPRTIDNGRECPHCTGSKTFPGMIIPV